MFRIGQSFDIHKLEPGNTFKLGLVMISGYKVIAHSDGDVLIHAITESILGALALGSLGEIFPENEENKNRDSQDFLLYAKNKLSEHNFKISNLDTMIFLESPKICDFVKEMQERIAAVLEIEIQQISIKPTTFEQLDSIGKSKAIAASSVVLISEA